MRVEVLLTAESAGHAPLTGAAVLVVDVLRASTTIVTALAAGCAGVRPVADPDEARQAARALGAGRALTAGERRGEPLPGFDCGNSPLEMIPDRVAGRIVVLTTSNGTRALLAVRGAAAVAVAGMVNVAAAAAWALATGLPVGIVCAGERGHPSLEDEVCAGLLVERLAAGSPFAELGASALSARALGGRYAEDVGRLARDSSWARHLADVGRGADVEACLAVDAFDLVPVWRPGAGLLVADGAREAADVAAGGVAELTAREVSELTDGVS